MKIIEIIIIGLLGFEAVGRLGAGGSSKPVLNKEYIDNPHGNMRPNNPLMGFKKRVSTETSDYPIGGYEANPNSPIHHETDKRVIQPRVIQPEGGSGGSGGYWYNAVVSTGGDYADPTIQHGTNADNPPPVSIADNGTFNNYDAQVQAGEIVAANTPSTASTIVDVPDNSEELNAQSPESSVWNELGSWF